MKLAVAKPARPPAMIQRVLDLTLTLALLWQFSMLAVSVPTIPPKHIFGPPLVAMLGVRLMATSLVQLLITTPLSMVLSILV